MKLLSEYKEEIDKLNPDDQVEFIKNLMKKYIFEYDTIIYSNVKFDIYGYLVLIRVEDNLEWSLFKLCDYKMVKFIEK